MLLFVSLLILNWSPSRSIVTSLSIEDFARTLPPSRPGGFGGARFSTPFPNALRLLMRVDFYAIIRDRLHQSTFPPTTDYGAFAKERNIYNDNNCSIYFPSWLIDYYAVPGGAARVEWCSHAPSLTNLPATLSTPYCWDNSISSASSTVTRSLGWWLSRGLVENVARKPNWTEFAAEEIY